MKKKKVINNIFEKPDGPFSAMELSKASGTEVVGNKNTLIKNINTLTDAVYGEITFLDNPKYKKDLKNIKASALIISEKYQSFFPKLELLLVSKNPYLSYAKIVSKFYPKKKNILKENINSSLNTECTISEKASILNNVTINKNSIINDNSTIGPNVFISEDCYIGRNVCISNAYLGKNTIVQDGTVIGQDGFGYVRDDKQYIKISQIGIVKIGNNVEIGCNCTIDRGSLKYTEIKDGVKIDNLVHIAHNVIIKENTVIAGQTGIAGSAIIGRNVMIGGQVGIAGHIFIGDNAKIGAQAGVTKDVEKNKSISGTPAIDLNMYLRKAIILNKMVKKNEK